MTRMSLSVILISAFTVAAQPFIRSPQPFLHDVNAGDVLCSSYTIQQGDICYNLALKIDSTVDKLLSYNPGVDCDVLEIGAVLQLCSLRTSITSISTPTTRRTSDSSTTAPGTNTVTTSSTSSCRATRSFSSPASNNSTATTSSKTTFPALNAMSTTSSAVSITTTRVSSSVTNTATPSSAATSLSSISTITSTSTSSAANSTSTPIAACITVPINNTDTCMAFSIAHGMKLAEFLALNPSTICGINGEAILQLGQKVCLPAFPLMHTTTIVAPTSTPFVCPQSDIVNITQAMTCSDFVHKYNGSPGWLLRINSWWIETCGSGLTGTIPAGTQVCASLG
ncbi:hypothetical protein D9758_005887 [Tetrapyrgos nigripes]|uniref:LysM domain-containing protein n=1 Tax=Tetrapyrgos nigripes TaxID=182062 RepID=A0A8H5G2Z9_9AGAR|nr:hypothetical protein D9758_005887 [Tetrapyrgos nigripes]